MQPKSDAEIAAMREGGRRLAQILNELAAEVIPGKTTKDIALSAAGKIKSSDLSPTLLGYQGFPDVICISLNDEVVHGIPSPERFIKEGDLVKLDLSVGYQGMIVDSALTVVAGKRPANQEVERLIKSTKQALEAGIAAIHGDGTALGDIGAAIQAELEKNKLGVVRDLVGHGVGHGLHEGLEVPNYGAKGSGQRLPAGTTIAVEPMSTLGDWQVGMLRDGWTVVTRDGSLSAHFEHTVLITETGAEILTAI